MKVTYLATVYRCERHPAKYRAAFPDLGGVMTHEASFDDLGKVAEELLEVEVLRRLADKKTLPPATEDYEKLVKKADPDLGAVGMVMPVTVLVKTRTVTVCITIPEDKLKLINNHCDEHAMNRSSFMTMAVLAYMRKHPNGD